MSLCENRSSGFPTRADTNRAVEPQKMARSFKFRIKIEEGLYYLYSKNKGADLLRGSASLFSHMQNVGFLMMRLICSMSQYENFRKLNSKSFKH